MRTNVRTMGTTALAGVLALAMLLVPAAPANAQEDDGWVECMNESFAGYNDCLMESSGWFWRMLCDLDWELEVTECSAEAVGQIRGAYQPH